MYWSCSLLKESIKREACSSYPVKFPSAKGLWFGSFWKVASGARLPMNPAIGFPNSKVLPTTSPVEEPGSGNGVSGVAGYGNTAISLEGSVRGIIQPFIYRGRIRQT